MVPAGGSPFVKTSPALLAVAALLLSLPAAFPPVAADAQTSQATTVVVFVPATGQEVTASLGRGDWAVTVTGKYTFGQSVNGIASEADAAYSFSGVYGSCYNWPGNKLDLHVNGVSPWSSHACQPITHTYTTGYGCASSPCLVTLWIKDDPYWDNSGGLTVTFTLAQDAT